jgi:acetylornithine deacetylase/succinyl-diaminopimelate desuccinylase-like protein
MPVACGISATFYKPINTIYTLKITKIFRMLVNARFHKKFILLIAFALQPWLINAQEVLNENQLLLKDIFKELIETYTVNTIGNTTKADSAIAARLTKAGFPAGDIKIVERNPRQGNVIFRLRGTGKLKPILLLAHIDVVNAKKEDWTFDPFKFTESDGYYYGRGTTDDKAMAAIFIANLIRYRKEGFVPDHDIIVCLSTDEEDVGLNGIEWLIKEHFDLINAELCITEGGRGQIIEGKHVLNEVQTSEKTHMSYTIEVKSTGGHSSLPTADNAIYRLSKALARLSDYTFPVSLNETTRGYFKVMSSIEKGQMASDMKSIFQNQLDNNVTERVSQVPFYNATLRTTCVATMLNAGLAYNALPESASAEINCRILPDKPVDDVLKTIKNVLADDKITITPRWEEYQNPPSLLSPSIIGKIEKVTQELWPGVKVIPMMGTGWTDGTYMRAAGVPTYGVSGIFEDINDIREHGKDERILKKSLFDGQEFLYRLIKELSKTE